MSPEIKHWIEIVGQNYQLFASCFSIFIVCMGIARWFGRSIGLKRAKSQRRKAGLPVASLMSGEEAWTYWGLFRGGLIGLLVAMVFLLNWPINMLSSYLSGAEPYGLTEIGNFFAPIIILGAVLAWNYFVDLMWPDIPRWMRAIYVYGAFIVAFVASLIVAYWWIVVQSKSLEANEILITVEIPLFVILFVSWSCLIGMREGPKAANPALNYPLVSVEVHQGKNLDQAWLYERTDSDYRLVTKSGSNHIIPAANVKEIRGPIEAAEVSSFI